MPYNFILVNVGTTLKNLSSLDDIFNLQNMSLLLSMSAVMMFVWCYKNSIKNSLASSSGGSSSKIFNFNNNKSKLGANGGAAPKYQSNSRFRSYSALPMEIVTNSYDGKATIV